MRQIEFLYDFGSPNAYLVHRALPALATRHNAHVTPVPILLGGVFKATNNQSPVTAFAGIPGKLAYQRIEIARFIQRHEIPFRFNPHFPVNTLTLMRAARFAQTQPYAATYIDTVFDAMWRDGVNMGDGQTALAVLNGAGLPGDAILAATQTPEIKSALIEATERAVARGVFGAPALFFSDQMFFGKDSLPDLEWALSQPVT
ncbi:MAG: 2-hydroxychromene-2-carboxylate isomerase [Rhodobacteraceae bacterium]|nr:2-hydroxychromene-2-carboxylate isomerase [Paracoccaceae bacterium]